MMRLTAKLSGRRLLPRREYQTDGDIALTNSDAASEIEIRELIEDMPRFQNQTLNIAEVRVMLSVLLRQLDRERCDHDLLGRIGSPYCRRCGLSWTSGE